MPQISLPRTRNTTNTTNFVVRGLLQKRWQKFSLTQQMANLGSEVSRALYWQKQTQPQNLNKAIDRALELFDLTIADSRRRRQLKEIIRLREIFCDYIFNLSHFQVDPPMIMNYFLPFALRQARRNSTEFLARQAKA